jgi:integrase
MRVQRTVHQPGGRITYELLDDDDQPIPEISAFLRHLTARDYSPNTLAAYAYDLLRLTQFLAERSWTYHDFTPARSLDLLEYLRHLRSRRPAQRLDLVLWTTEAGHATTRLSSTTINRSFAAVSSFYEYLIVSAQFAANENPIQQRDALAHARVSEQHRPFLTGINRQRPVRRVVRVKTVQHLPRPLGDEQIAKLVSSLQCGRDKAMVLLMLPGGLRPGEVLNLDLEDIQDGRRRVIVRYRTHHPKGVRTKSRTERVVDLLEPETLQASSAYVLHERPPDANSPFVFLVGGAGGRRHEPLSYQALVKLFQRHCARLGIREPWVTPHALRHTHATRMWEGGMRELTLQKRLGHASPEATRVYTRVSDPVVVAAYRRALGGETDQ